MSAFLATPPKPYEPILVAAMGWLVIVGFGLASERAFLPVAMIATAVGLAINALWWGIERVV